MKNKLYLILTAFTVIICGCNSTSSRVDYLPCQVDQEEDWGFVNAKGKIFCRDAFTNQPTEVREGIFFVKEGPTYSMYQFNKKRPKLILNDIADFGCITDGLVPICKKDSHITIVDAKGYTKFVLGRIDNQDIISCAPKFKYGYLSICMLDHEGEKRYGVIDKCGKIVIYPKYKEIKILSSNLFHVIEEGDENQQLFIDKAEKIQTQWENDLDIRYISDKYIVVSKDDRFCVCNMDGDVVFKCPSKVEYIRQFKNGFLVFSGEDYNLSYGVMDLNGEIIISAKFHHISIIKDGFLAEKENGDVQLYDTKGKLVAEINDGFEYIDNIEGFGNLKNDGRHYYILDKKLKPVSKIEFDDIRTHINYSDVSSEYFDISEVINSAHNALKSVVKDKFGQPVTRLNFITSEGTSIYKNDTKIVTSWFDRGVKYSIDVTFEFDNNILTPTYIEKQIQHEDWLWGTYHTTEKIVGGYDFNDEALLKQIRIECSVPASKKEMLKNALTSLLEGYAEYDLEGNFFNDNCKYYLSGVTIVIEPYKDRSK